MIVFFSNFFNHHQALVASELYSLTNGKYAFVETMPMPNWIAKSGYPELNEPYIVKAWKDEECQKYAFSLSETADVCVFGGPETIKYAVHRAKVGKISFQVGERCLKKGWLNILSPRLLVSQWYYYTLFRKHPFYYLCSSAFASHDLSLLKSYKNKCYKWGYFTQVDENINAQNRSYKNHVSMMWCARFLDWKHPELPVLLASELKRKHYDFHIDMYGSGEHFDKIKQLISSLKVEDVVMLKGNLPNTEILKEMSYHDIFLFTSDRQEGWGAVANEAMSQGCILVGSDEIGSVPYLVKDKVNGVLFRSKSISSLCDRVIYLLEHRDLWSSISQNAIQTMQIRWSPKIAARNLLTLIKDLQSGNDTSIVDGPCSKA